MKSKPILAMVVVVLVAVGIGLAVFVLRKASADLEARRKAEPAKVASPARPAPEARSLSESKPGAPGSTPVRRRDSNVMPKAPPRSNAPPWVQAMDAGIAAYRDKRPEDALRLYADALTEADKSGRRAARALVLSNTGSLYWSMRRLDEAEVYLLRATAITDLLTESEIVADLGSHQALLVERTERMLGIVYLDQRKDADAARRFGNAVAATRKLSGVRPELIGMTMASDLYQLARAQCRLGALDTARKSLDQALRANPQTPGAAHQVKSIEALRAEIDKGQPCRR